MSSHLHISFFPSLSLPLSLSLLPLLFCNPIITPGGYTVVLKSEGIVKKYQADVLGVYRMVDSYNDRPVYKQDGGENYIYYRSLFSLV